MSKDSCSQGVRGVFSDAQIIINWILCDRFREFFATVNAAKLSVKSLKHSSALPSILDFWSADKYGAFPGFVFLEGWATNDDSRECQGPFKNDPFNFLYFCEISSFRNLCTTVTNNCFLIVNYNLQYCVYKNICLFAIN